MSADRSSRSGRSGSSRRQFLLGGAVAGLGAAAAVGADFVITRTDNESSSATTNGSVVVDFYGAHQAGIEVAPQAHSNLIALDLVEGVDRDA
ncbi:MAG TPA: peroxidase, partial [Rhodoglobus sp.]|nr:peroxidase [Rhodoglobus sp.]